MPSFDLFFVGVRPIGPFNTEPGSAALLTSVTCAMVINPPLCLGFTGMVIHLAVRFLNKCYDSHDSWGGSSPPAPMNEGSRALGHRSGRSAAVAADGGGALRHLWPMCRESRRRVFLGRKPVVCSCGFVFCMQGETTHLEHHTVWTHLCATPFWNSKEKPHIWTTPFGPLWTPSVQEVNLSIAEPRSSRARSPGPFEPDPSGGRNQPLRAPSSSVSFLVWLQSQLGFSDEVR